MVYEDYHEFNQEQYHADVRIYDQQNDSDTELHLFHGIGVTIEMAVHDAAYSVVARLRGEHNASLDVSEFRYILYAPVGDATGYYTAICAPYEPRRYDPQILIQCTQALDRTVRALSVELFATRARYYEAMTQLLPAVRAGIHPEHILYPRRTEMPPGIDWPAVGGHAYTWTSSYSSRPGSASECTWSTGSCRDEHSSSALAATPFQWFSPTLM
jgi:hypothetical protein